jgi:hypothetical protein
MKTTTDIAVVHLVRAANAVEALIRFLDSYLDCPAGLPHKLVFLLKGFGAELPRSVAERLDSVRHSRIYCPDKGYDIASYFYAAERLSESLVLFINSFSVLQGDRWLLKLQNAYQPRDVGLVGATGSWESISVDSSPNLISMAKALALSLPLRALFPAFPNPHVRTNAFLLARKDFLAMRPRLMHTKLGAWLFESGRNSMTRQILRRGLEVIVVGRDGSMYRPEEWPRSLTFWQSKQENLLIQDNRTLAYENGDADTQAKRFRSAWICFRGSSDASPRR